MTTTNDELKELINKLSNTVHGKLNILKDFMDTVQLMLRASPPVECEKILLEIIEQNKTIIEILGEGYTPPAPPVDEHTPLFSSGAKGTRRVQMSVNTRVRIPKVNKDGSVMIKNGKLFYWKPTDGIRLNRGEVHVVWRPYVQGDGDRLWEMYEYPGRFIKNRQCSFV